MTDLISGRVRGVFRAAASGVVLGDIDRIWQAEGFAPGAATADGGQRVTRWSEYESSVDWSNPAHTRRVLRVYESFLSEFVTDNAAQFTRALALDGFTIDDLGRINAQSSPVRDLSGLDALRDPSGIRDAFSRIELLLDANPAVVVGAVKDLIEATAKTVVEALGGTYHRSDEMPALATNVQDSLGLTARGVPDSVDSAPSIRRVLGGLASVAQGIAELRNVGGSGRGRSTAPNLSHRHARLALNAGRAWREITLDTYADPAAPWRKLPRTTPDSPVEGSKA